MGVGLVSGNIVDTLSANAIATGCKRYILITTLAPVGGGAFQSSGYAGICPARRPLPGHAVQFVILQVIGGLLGVWVAHAMLDQEIWQM